MRDETVKLIIEISKDYYEILKCEVEENQTDYYPFIVIGNGIPLDEVLDKISTEIKERIDKVPMTSFRNADLVILAYRQKLREETQK